MKRWRGDFRKEEYCQTYRRCFYLEELTQIEWSVRKKKQKNGRAYETKIKDKEYHFDYCFEFGTNTNSRFIRISFNQLSKFKRLPVVYKTIYQKESDKIVYFGYFFFHWLEIEQIEKVLTVISKFELSIKKIVQTREKNLTLVSIVFVSILKTSIKLVDWEVSKTYFGSDLQNT